MTWPTLPAFSSSNFLDHFPGSSLDAAKWAAVTTGTGAVTVTDSYVDMSAPAGSTAFVYYKTKLDKTKSQLWTICFSPQQAAAGGITSRVIQVMNGAGLPAADTNANIVARTLITGEWAVNSGRSVVGGRYYTNAGATRYHNTTTKAWEAAYPTGNDQLLLGQADDYYIIGLEVDAPNSRWRLIGWCQAFVTPGTYTFEQGGRLFLLTDWVTWANTRDSTDLWLASGILANDTTTAHGLRIEWVRYAEALAGNNPVEAWISPSKDTSGAPAGNHRIRRCYTYDGKVFIPQDRTTNTLDLGSAGAPDEFYLQDPCAASDGTTDYLFYRGVTPGGTHTICVAS
jgi:hypothetical protein